MFIFTSCFIGNQILDKVEKLYNRANASYVNSEEFIRRVQETVMEVRLHPATMFVTTKDLFNEIKAYRAKEPETKVKAAAAGAHESNGAAAAAGDMNGDESVGQDGTASETSASESTHRKPSARQIARLEDILGKYHKEIRRYEQKELSLADLDQEDNDYLVQERLKKRASKIYNRLCELTGRSKDTGGTREKKVRYSGSRYNEVNIHVQKFINKHSLEERMPDYTDIRKIIKKCNEKYEYRLNQRRIVDLSKEVRFRDHI